MISRRKFLAQSGLASAAALLCTDLFSCTPGNKQDYIGLQLYSLRDEIPVAGLEAVLKRIASAGYNSVEMYGYSNIEGFFKNTAKQTAALLKTHNLISPSGHCGIEYFDNGGGQEQIDAALTLGHKYIVIPYLPEELRKTPDDYKKVCAKLNDIGAVCKKNNLKLLYHNHAFEFDKLEGGTQAGYDIMLKETDPELVNFEMDLFWVVTGERNPVDLFKQHPGRFKLWHVKDMDKVNPKLNTEIGSGTIDFKPIFANAALSGLDYFYVEQENFAMDPDKSISQSNAYIKSQLLKK